MKSLSSARPYMVTQQEITFNKNKMIDRFLLVGAIVLLPLQEQFSILAGSSSTFSIMWIFFALMGLYAFVRRPQNLQRAAVHPVFIAAYILLVIGFIMESVHGNSDYGELKSYAFMVGGALVVAALCSDRQSLKAVFYGYVGASLWLAIFLILTFYGQFHGTTATTLNEATSLRDAIFRETSLATGLNTMASQMAQGTVLALTLTLTDKSSRRRIFWMVMTLFCMLASFLPMSRGTVLMIVFPCLLVMLAYRGRRLRAFFAIAVLTSAVVFWLPSVVFTRFLSSTTTSYYSSLLESTDQKDADGRSHVYSAAVQNLPEYVALGVGAGNFWKSWASGHGFGTRRGVLGAHNCFLQITIYWGLPGLLALLVVLISAYRCLPKRCGLDPLSLGLLGLGCSLLVWMLMMHNLYAKEFSLGLGLLVGARIWIWPNGVPSRSQARVLKINLLTRRSLRRKRGGPEELVLRRATMSPQRGQ